MLVSQPETSQGNGVAVADPEQGADAAQAPIRSASGVKSRFDEIVNPHPVVAFLFRRRTFLVLLGMLAMVPFARPNPRWMAIGIMIMVLAEALRVWAAGTIHKSEEVTTGGPYAFIRHPLYVGSFFHTIAYCFMSGHWQSFLFAVPYFLLFYSAAVNTEEQMLRKLFGEQYDEYSLRVPRFVPRLARPQPGHGQFSWRQVMWNKEWVNILWEVALSTLFLLQAR